MKLAARRFSKWTESTYFTNAQNFSAIFRRKAAFMEFHTLSKKIKKIRRNLLDFGRCSVGRNVFNFNFWHNWPCRHESDRIWNRWQTLELKRCELPLTYFQSLIKTSDDKQVPFPSVSYCPDLDAVKFDFYRNCLQSSSCGGYFDEA